MRFKAGCKLERSKKHHYDDFGVNDDAQIIFHGGASLSFGRQ